MDSAVAMIIPSWGKRCGVAEYTKDLVGALSGLGVDVKVFRGEEVIAWESAGKGLSREGVRLFHFQYEYHLYDLLRLRRLLGLLRRQRVPLVATVHDFFSGQVEANRLIVNAFDAHIVLTPKVRDALIRIGAPRGRIYVIPMGCRQYVLHDERETRSKLGIGEGPAIGFFGFAMPQKGIIELLLAAESLRRRFYPGLKCFLFAPGAFFADRYVAELAGFIAQHGMSSWAFLNSSYLPIEEVVQYLHAMDVNVLPYKEQNYIGASSAVRVLISARKPIITTDIPYFADLGSEVYKIPSPDPGSLAEAIRALLEAPAKRSELIEAMSAYLRWNGWHMVAGEHLAVYNRLRSVARVEPKAPAMLPLETALGNLSLPEASLASVGEMLAGSLPQAYPNTGVPEWVWRRLIERFGRRG